MAKSHFCSKASFFGGFLHILLLVPFKFSSEAGYSLLHSIENCIAMMESVTIAKNYDIETGTAVTDVAGLIVIVS